jgi:hypothetical protein
MKGRGGIDDWRFTVPADAPLVPKTCMDTTVGTSLSNDLEGELHVAQFSCLPHRRGAGIHL